MADVERPWMARACPEYAYRMRAFRRRWAVNGSRPQWPVALKITNGCVAQYTLVKGDQRSSDDLLRNQMTRAMELRDRLEGIALDVLARRLLAENPQSHGLQPSALSNEEFIRTDKERSNALMTVVTQAYRNLWFPGSGGTIIRRELSTAGGEGGASVIETIKEVLDKEGELVTGEHTDSVSALASLSKLFFEQKDLRSLEELKTDFASKRHWPVLAEKSVFEQLIRGGVRHGAWCLLHLDDAADGMPDQYFDRTGSLPFDLSLSETGWYVVTPQGAKKRGWSQSEKPDAATVGRWVEEEIKKSGYIAVHAIAEAVSATYGEVSQNEIGDAVDAIIRNGTVYVHDAEDDPITHPGSLKTGKDWIIEKVKPTQKVITKAEAVKQGMLQVKRDVIHLQGEEGVEKVWPLLKNLGQLYKRGATSPIDYLEISRMALPNGARLELRLEDAKPEDIKALDELFDLMVDLVKKDAETYIGIDINTPEDGCELVNKLK